MTPERRQRRDFAQTPLQTLCEALVTATLRTAPSTPWHYQFDLARMSYAHML
jgi:hypothetical protein